MKGEVLDFVRALPEQDIQDIGFERTDDDMVMVRLKESFSEERRYCDAPLLSDGTLRVLSIAAALLSVPEGSLVSIEDIDNGVHPSRAGLLLERIFAVAQSRNLNVLITTHNPALLDALPVEAIPKVACCYRDPKEGSSKIVHLEDLSSYAELVALGPLGQSMTKNLIARFVKDPRTKEERAEASLAWLKRMEETEQ